VETEFDHQELGDHNMDMIATSAIELLAVAKFLLALWVVVVMQDYAVKHGKVLAKISRNLAV
jgi:hypothetical protein